MKSTDETAIAGRSPLPDIAAPTAQSRPATAAWPRLDPELVGELHGGPWDYPWELAPGIVAPVADPLARQTAWVREAMIEPHALDALAVADARVALDLSCGEGRLGQRLLDWGAKRVIAATDDAVALHRARLLRAHLGIDPAELELCPRGEVDASAGPDHDIVLAIPIGNAEEELIAAAAARCRGIFVLECADADTDRIATAALAAGFESVERLTPPMHAVPPFLLGEREILIARARRER